jgi:hypothetical protein
MAGGHGARQRSAKQQRLLARPQAIPRSQPVQIVHCKPLTGRQGTRRDDRPACRAQRGLLGGLRALVSIAQKRAGLFDACGQFAEFGGICGQLMIAKRRMPPWRG